MPQIVTWTGSPPPRAVARALTDARFTVERRDGTDHNRPAVISTSSGRPPSAPPGISRWIWVSTSSISASRAIEAVRRGAYAALSLAAADAPAKLIARLQELAIAHDAPQPPTHIVAGVPRCRPSSAGGPRGADIDAGLDHGWTGAGK
jgi:hypothetical protein